MMESKKLHFEISYTLDLLCFIDILLGTTPYKNTDIAERFKEALSDESRKSLKKINKVLPKRESIQSLIAPLVVADSEFATLKIVKTTEILANPHYLINEFKKSPQYKTISPTYKKFLKKKARKVLGFLGIIVGDLEQTKFKSFWLSKQLPITKNKISEYKENLLTINLVDQLNSWSDSNMSVADKKIYVLTFTTEGVVSLLNGDSMVSGLRNSIQLIRSLVEETFASESFEKELKPLKKKFKKNKELMAMFKSVKKEYKTVTHYIESSLLLALMTYLNEQFGAITQPHDYLKSHHFGKHKVAVLFYEYIKLFPKSESQRLPEYFLELLDIVELQNFEQDVDRISVSG